MDDNAGANTIVGTFREDSVSSDPALANAIENRTLRTVLLTKETHSKETFSSQTSGLVIDYMNQALHGNVSIADADKGGMVFAWREFLNFCSAACHVRTADSGSQTADYDPQIQHYLRIR